MGYKGIVYLDYSGATLATHQGGKNTWSVSQFRQDQTKSSVRMHSVRAVVMRRPYCHPSYQDQFIGHIYISCSFQHFASFIYSSICSAIWRRKVVTISKYFHMISDTMA